VTEKNFKLHLAALLERQRREEAANQKTQSKKVASPR